MSGHQYEALENTVFFYFGANDTSGSGGDGATPLFDVREAGAAASAIPLLSGTPTLLTHANFPAGCYEVAVAATAANGFAEGDVFSVFATLAIDSQNPTGFIGSCKLTPHATSAQVDAIGAASGGSVNIQATEDNTGGAIIDGITFVGSVQGATTFANTEAADGVYHDIDDTGNDIDIVYGFSVGGGRTGGNIIFEGFVQGNGDEMKIKAFDHVGSDWEIIATIPGQNGTANIVLEPKLLLKHTGTGSELGKVYIRFDTDSTTPSNLSVDQLLVSAVNIGQSVGYANGQIWIDTVNGVAGTEAFVNGVADNPVNLIASAKSLSTSVGISDFHIINGSTITLAESTANESYFGDNWTLALGSQDVDGAYFQGAHVSGIGTSATEVHFEGCDVATASVQIGHFDFCSFDGTVTHTLAGDYEYHNCYSNIAGVGAPIFTKTAGQAITAEWRNWMDSITVSGLEAGDSVTINGRLGTVTLNGADAAVEIRGSYKSIVNNLTGSPTVNLDGAWQGSDIADMPASVWDRIISMANHNIGQSAGKILRQSGDLVQIDGAVSDVSPTTTGFDTNLTQADTYWDDAVLIFTNGAANVGKGHAITSYLNASGAVTFDADDAWAVTPVNGDDFVIFANHVHPVSEIADAVLDEVNTGAAHNVVNSLGRQIRETRETNVYADNRIWIDTVNGAAGTTDFENGTLDNPVDSIADANILAASLGISRFMILNGSSITFAAAQTSQNFFGDNWTLALGGQSIVGSKITGATVSGVASGVGTLQIFENCRMGAVSHVKDTHIQGCSLSGTQTLVEAGDIFFDQCHSAVAGMGSVTFDFGAALNSSNLNVRHHSGGWTIANMGAGTGTYEASFEGNGQIIWAASCSATSNASIRGNWKITDNAGGAVTETLDDNQAGVDAIPTVVLAAGDIDGFSLEETLKLILASAAAKLSGAATVTVTIRAADDSKDRITATVDADGNRTAVTLDAAG